MVRSDSGKAYQVGESAYHLYIPAKVGTDSCFPFNGTTGAETQVDIVSDGSAVMVSDGSIPEETLQEVREVLSDAE